MSTQDRTIAFLNRLVAGLDENRVQVTWKADDEIASLGWSRRDAFDQLRVMDRIARSPFMSVQPQPDAANVRSAMSPGSGSRCTDPDTGIPPLELDKAAGAAAGGFAPRSHLGVMALASEADLALA